MGAALHYTEVSEGEEERDVFTSLKLSQVAVRVELFDVVVVVSLG